jgi:plasmid stability protein
MAETVAQQLARLQLEIQNLHAQLQAKTHVTTATKDLSMATMTSKFSEADKTLTAEEFFSSIEAAARLGNWTDLNKREVCIFKLTDTAKAFYDATSELHSSSRAWDNFKTLFHKR